MLEVRPENRSLSDKLVVIKLLDEFRRECRCVVQVPRGVVVRQRYMPIGASVRYLPR